ncbi:MAG TPA: signal peptidase II [Beijerinckiaceae bacterium]|nr:signal peptidase II [Beijerinckiaceae bacterium]
MTNGRSPFRAGLIGALTTLALDQASKLWLLFGLGLPAHYPVSLAPWFDLTVVWNRGISYGLFQQDSELGRWALIAFKLVAAIGLVVWMGRCTSRATAVGLGLIAGGAVGNAIDRIAYGAVFDFAHLHWGTFSWYVFNLADAAIVAGVPLLLYPEPKSR